MTAPSPNAPTPHAATSSAARSPVEASPKPAANIPAPVDESPEAPPAVENPVPALADDSGKAFAQTEDRPKTDSAFFAHLKQTLFAAIQKDDPGHAQALFFPIEAYRQVKNIAKPDRDYETRLLKAFARDIHDYHKRLGKNPDGAKLIDLEVPEARARWMKPGSEGNKLGYFRVLRSRLRFTDAEGKEHALEITSLISWRGEWYVVHVNGFK
ncbi:MAG TPA: hypothetical protein PKD61_00830 [Polyangiaceae bacterium]|nr:hypothetical protein [Polyangiaceae bacterium]